MKLKFQFLFFLLFSLNVFSQELLPFVENFTKSNYNGDNQVWSVTQGKDNAMYFANNHYFLRYNGVKWERYSLPNKTVIRSVFAHNEKIYCGSYNEFGYWKRENGIMRYYSLTKDKDFFKDASKNEEIWKIFELNGTIYFQSFNEIFIYNNNSIKRVEVPFLISYCFVIDSKIYVASVNRGVFEFDGKNFIYIKKWDAVLNNVIHAIAKNNNEIYIFTLKNGVFVEKNEKLQPWNHPINEALKSEVIITAKFYQKNKLVLGTASKGVYIVQMDSGEFININRNNRLSNNSVLSISVDKENDIWLGLDNGISHIEINSPFRIFSDNTGELGTVYSIAASKNGYLLASNHGVFTYENKSLKIVPNSQGQVWNVKKIDDNFVIGHNDGTFLYDFKSYRKINPLNGGWQLKKDLYHDRYIQSNYLGLAFFENKNDFSQYKRLNTVYRPIKDFVQTGQYEIIASDSYRGLFKIKYNEKLELVSYLNLTEKNNIKSDFGVKIFKYKNDVLYYINSEWYYLDGVTDVLKKYELFNQNFKNISEVIPIDDSSFAILKGGLFYIINQSNDHFSWKLIPKKYYEGKIINQETRIFKFNEHYLVNLDDGFLQFESNKNNFINQKVEIEAYFNGKILDDEANIPNNQSLTLHFVSEYFGNKKSTLFYKLNNQSIVPLTDGKLILNNLSSGNNSIEVYFTNGFEFVKTGEFSFTVLKPWYLSIWMIILYFAIVGGILFLYYRWNKVRYQEKIKLKEEELKHHRQIMELEMEAENKLKLQDYEKHILEMQVQSKASEVAGKSLSIAKQSEMIESIQRILEEEKNINTVKTKIKKAIKSNAINQREWENFEKNLIQSHEEFVQKLTNTYPELTSKDIKLSIYLRMNLSSKEIAPLMNISYRGVELHRYRLRKKIQLNSEESLSRFMINL
ncbi:histidine kinase [Flavobacterium azooxidireducens]|uniref:Histidine kinase n=1 Tax=Flavobacterium azooxidireducens TaxID=1871076 RepID=A0ABY4KDG4_9FLAO|nr:histidine kinase [Flavobacterium azooxidireducens]UPQ78356.1 histidine kinase [Flavobacterium azooxidireducens]